MVAKKKGCPYCGQTEFANIGDYSKHVAACRKQFFDKETVMEKRKKQQKKEPKFFAEEPEVEYKQYVPPSPEEELDEYEQYVVPPRELNEEEKEKNEDLNKKKNWPEELARIPMAVCPKELLYMAQRQQDLHIIGRVDGDSFRIEGIKILGRR